jgi:hypothetical protein
MCVSDTSIPTNIQAFVHQWSLWDWYDVTTLRQQIMSAHFRDHSLL